MGTDGWTELINKVDRIEGVLMELSVLVAELLTQVTILEANQG